MEKILEKLQGEWNYKETGFSFIISGENIIVDGKIKSVLGLKKIQHGWQLSIVPMGCPMLIIKYIDDTSMVLYDLSQEFGVINLPNCASFSLFRN